MWLSPLWRLWAICLLVTLVVSSNRCVLKRGLTKSKCNSLTNIGCPVQFLGSGCTNAKHKSLGDGGCQPVNTCPFCCSTRCNQAKKFGCMWDPNTKTCLKCWSGGAADNGLPATPGAPIILPADWSIYGLGDSFTIHSNCNTNAEFITGVTVYLAETDSTIWNDPLTVLPSRLVLFYHDPGFRVGEWQGNCTASAMETTSPIIWMVTCDFSTSGSIIYPSACQYPSLPGGTYDLLYQVSASPTLGWVQTLKDAGCNTAPCAFSQQMSSVVGPRVDVCTAINPNYQNFAFQILGTNAFVPIAGCV